MIITPIKTKPITTKDTDLFQILDDYILSLKENSVLVVTSKIVAICEGRVVPKDIDKDELIAQEADFFLPRSSNKYNVCLTIKNGILAASAGIDESNGDDHYVLLPKDPQTSANSIRDYLKKKFNLKNIGVIITDSITSPLRWGVRGTALAYSGFKPFKSYIDQPDIFGRKMHYSKVFLPDNLATSACLVMGEGDERQPLAIIEDINFVEFVDQNPSQEELDSIKIDPQDDLYASLLKSVQWQKGKNKG